MISVVDVDLGDIENIIHDNVDDTDHTIDGMHNFAHHMMDRIFDYPSMPTVELPQPTPHLDGTKPIVGPIVEPAVRSIETEHLIKLDPTTQVNQFNQVEPTMQLQPPPKSPKSKELVWVDEWVPRVIPPASQKNQAGDGE